MLNSSSTSSSLLTEVDKLPTNDEIESPPVHLLSDYIEMAYLAFVILLGAPSNCFILKRLLEELKRTPRDSVKAGFLILKINLNITDLLLLGVVALGKLLWLATYTWMGGMVLCKVFNFLCMVALYISSNIVVCIALDRLRNVLGANKIRRGKANGNTITVLVTSSWLLAILWSIPQLFAWDTLNVYPEEPGGWVQCTDIWAIHRFTVIANQTSPSPWYLHDYSQNAYNIAHLFLVFWGPLVVLVISYAIIAIRLMQYSLKGPCQSSLLHDVSPSRKPSTCPQTVEMSLNLTSTTVAAHKTSTAKISLSTSRPSSGLEEDPPLLDATRTKKKISFFGRKKSDRLASPGVKLPAWRRQLRSKVFRTTLLVVVAHFLFWFPYNFMAIMQFVNESLYKELNDHANIFKDMQILITLINPFLYGFTH